MIFANLIRLASDLSWSNKRFVLCVTAVVISASLSAVAIQMKSIDSALFGAALKYFQEPTPTQTVAQFYFVNLFGLFIFTALGIWSSFKIKSRAKIVVGAQLSVLAIAFEWTCWQLFQVSAQPLSLEVSLIAGMVAGAILRRLSDEQQRYVAKEIELSMRMRELNESRETLMNQDEVERRILAGDLHDQILNDLRSVLNKIDKFASKPEPDELDKVKSQLKLTMNDIRAIMDDLCPIILSEFGLAAAIEDRLDKAAQDGKMDVRFINSLPNEEELEALSDSERQLIYRLVQECITNACKHSQASLLSVTVAREAEELVFRINDNGKGVDFEKFSDVSRGTLYMRLRAKIINGRITWSPGSSGVGTAVEISIISRLSTQSGKSGESSGSSLTQTEKRQSEFAKDNADSTQAEESRVMSDAQHRLYQSG